MIIVFSDAHFWPDDPSPAYRALLKFLEMHKQEIKCIVNNGDAFDGASISRFPPLNFNKIPTVQEELQACIDSLTEIENRVLKQTPLIWCLGNHDARYEQLIVNKVPELQGLKGTSLKDYFPMWLSCYSLWINMNLVIKHRNKGGAMAGRNNTIHGGVNFVTGHTHVGCVNPFNDYNGTRYGVQTGTLANPLGRQFEYCEDNPKDWMECFAVLSFHNGKLLMPELCKVFDNDHFEFRGKVYESHS
jgi:3',5'-cyclic AMP phosphodiesterase CpdA